MTNLIHTSPAVSSLILTQEDASLVEVVHQWHDDNHPDGRAVCLLEPCAELHQYGSSTYEQVRDWHDTSHRDSWSSCMEQPCHAVKRIHDGPYALNVGLRR